jgi:hypothetical protein
MTYAADPKFTLSAAAAAFFVLAASPAIAVTDQPTNQEAATKTPPSVLAFSQKPKDGAVEIGYVHLPESGYVAIFADEHGKRSAEALGFTALDKGSHNNVRVKLGNDLAPGSALWASLYKDVDGDKVLDTSKDVALWPNGDPPQNRFLID